MLRRDITKGVFGIDATQEHLNITATDKAHRKCNITMKRHLKVKRCCLGSLWERSHYFSIAEIHQNKIPKQSILTVKML